MSDPRNAPGEREHAGAAPDDDLITGMGGGDDPIVDGVAVESDLEENPYDATAGSAPHMQGDVRGEESGIPDTPPNAGTTNEPEDLGFDELDPEAEDRTWGA